MKEALKVTLTIIALIGFNIAVPKKIEGTILMIKRGIIL